ncbi:hypothetical protein Dsin_027072 [Dipteronia sinensis]|uniref:TF-B3 domain-containing protein n=1 Tax=Dipteronia sinensis TaxID=43782 RepID=A0AAD9ZZE4_9ROSI|nr:hypothetical protein Dsin_027072 [Dipteronia sinensis]
MDDHQAANETTPHQLSLSKQNPTDSKPKIKRRKTAESKMKLAQNSEKPVDPSSCTEIVAYDNSKDPESGQKRAMIDELYDHAIAKPSATERAEEVRANLEATFPSFEKSMVRSNVTHGFWLHLPMRFCKLHMPKVDTGFFLETENGAEYQVNYISQRTALSGGWKAFCDANQLLEGDVLVFHLVGPEKFKVYIVRANGIPNFAAEARPLNSGLSQYFCSRAFLQFVDVDCRKLIIFTVPLDVELEATPKDQSTESMKNFRRAKRLRRLPARLQDNIQSNSPAVSKGINGHAEVHQLEKDGEDLGPNTLEGAETSESIGNFKGVKSIDNFTIIVNNLAIDSEISHNHRTKYYELCSSQHCYLHDHLLRSINCKLAAEIITQTVNIAEAIRSCNISTSRADYEIWDKTLKGFELLGMNVGFLRDRLQRLMTLSLESEESTETKRLKEVCVEQAHAEEEMRILELKLLTLKETIGRLDFEVESLKVKAERHGLMFWEEVNAPW